MSIEIAARPRIPGIITLSGNVRDGIVVEDLQGILA